MRQDGVEILPVGKGWHTEDDDVGSRYGFAGILGDEGGCCLDLQEQSMEERGIYVTGFSAQLAQYVIAGRGSLQFVSSQIL